MDSHSKTQSQVGENLGGKGLSANTPIVLASAIVQSSVNMFIPKTFDIFCVFRSSHY